MKKIQKKQALNLIFAVLVFVIAGIVIWQLSGNSTNPSNTNNIKFSFIVKGCAETDHGMASKSVGLGKEQYPEIEVSGNSIIYSRAIKHLCCRKAEFKKEINGNKINIYEVWSGIGCKCICFSELKAKVENLEKGKYIINVYETGTQPGTENVPMNQTLIISQNVVIK